VSDEATDSEVTLIACGRCGARFRHGTGRNADGCPNCDRRSLTPSQAARSLERRDSAPLVSFAEDARKLAERLEKDNRVATKTYAAKARVLASTFAAWMNVPPGDHERREAIAELIDLYRASLDVLTSKR